MVPPMLRRTALRIVLGGSAAAAATGLTAGAAMARVTPAITLELDALEYVAGDTMTLNVTENLNPGVQRTFEVTPLSDGWRQVGDDDRTVTFEATATGEGQQFVAVQMTRTSIDGIKWQDGAQSLVQTVSYLVTAVVEPPPTATLIGRSSSTNNHQSLTQCDVIRRYTFGNNLDAELAESGATALFLSDEPDVRNASDLDAKLDQLFSRHPDIQVHWLPANEITAVSGGNLSQSQANAYIELTRTQRAVIDQYPNAYMSINFTAYGVRQGKHNNLEPCAEYLHNIISSCYNPGRMKSPPVWDPYSQYLDHIMDAVAEWSDLAGTRLGFGTGEFGNPVDPRDPNKRPTYAAGAIQYLRDGCAERDLPFFGFCWWDQQKSGGPNNRLSTDGNLTSDAIRGALS